MKLSPILSASVALLLAACGTDLFGEGKGDAYYSSVKQADEARMAGDLDAAVPLDGRALEANPNGVEAKVGLAKPTCRPACPTRPPPCSATCSTGKRAIRSRGAALPWR